MEIYALQDGQEIGPLSVEKTRLLLAQGSLSGEALAWTPGRSKWEPLSTFLPPATETTPPPELHLPLAAAVEPTPPPAPPPTAPPAASWPALESSTPKQRALLAFLHIPFTLTTSRQDAALLLSDALENPAYSVRLGQWPKERLHLHGDLFVAELHAQRENRAQHYLALAQTEGAALFSGLTRSHAQSVVTLLDLERPTWEAQEATAVRDHFFPMLAKKFPHLVRPDAKGLKSPDAPAKAATPRPGARWPVAALARAAFFALLAGGLVWFALKILRGGPVSPPSTTAVAPAIPPVVATPAAEPEAPLAPPPAAAPLAEAPAPPAAPQPEPTPSAPLPIAAAAPAPSPTSASPRPAPPANVRLIKAHNALLPYGSTMLPEGTALKCLGWEGVLLKVQYLDTTFLVPPGVTNYAALSPAR